MWSYGTNLLDLNYIKSDPNNPVFDQMGRVWPWSKGLRLGRMQAGCTPA
jgi:hypothetical protein